MRFGRPDEVARSVRAVLNTPTMSTAYGIAAADRARSRFPWKRIAVETEIAYNKARPEESRSHGGENDVESLLMSASHR
jgi:hypothetical protein